MHTVSALAKELGIEKHLHLWPDQSLGNQSLADRMPNPGKYLKRLENLLETPIKIVSVGSKRTQTVFL